MTKNHRGLVAVRGRLCGYRPVVRYTKVKDNVVWKR